MLQIKIGNRIIGDNLDPYIIAEIGVNHEGSMELARRLIDEAIEGGAHAVKFQTYKADKIASKFSPAYWDLSKEATTSQHELFKKYDSFGESEYRQLAEYTVSKGAHFMSTPFDLDAVEFLEPLVPAFKIASADVTNVPLLRKVAKTGKPVILSTGASTLPEIEFAIETLKTAGCNQLALLHCVLNYPTPRENAQLSGIKTLQRVFPDCLIGYSDHVVPDETISALEAAMLLGATVLEKHFTHDKSLPGNDHYHAMDKHDLKRFCEKIVIYRELIGQHDTKQLQIEMMARAHARRSIVAARSIKPGDVIDESSIIAKRPGGGISPIHWDEIVGKKALMEIEEDSLLKWSQLDG